jgi:CHAT domain-containing protein
MSFSPRLCGCLLAFSLGLLSLQPHTLAQPQTADETALHTLAKSFYRTWAAQDLDGFLGCWSLQAPELAARRKSAIELFASHPTINLNSLAVRRVSVTGVQARLRVETDVQVLEAQTGKAKPGYGKQLRTLECVKEDGAWKVRREVSTFDDLAVALNAASQEPERAALLAAEQELVTAELVKALNNQSRRLVSQNKYPQALASFALAQRLAEQLNDQTGLSDALMGTGYIHWVQGNYNQALPPFRQSLALRETLGDKFGMARILNNLGNVFRSQGDYEQAQDYYLKSLALFEALNEKADIASELGNLGVVYVSQGNLARALDYYQRSLALSQAENDKLGVAITLGNIGAVYRKQGNYAQALDHYQKSLSLSETIEDKIGIAQMLNNIGIVYQYQGDSAQALEYAQKSLALSKSLGDNNGIAGQLTGIANIYDAQGNYAQATEFFQKGLSMFEASGDQDGVARTLVNLGVSQKRQGHYAKALEFYDRATTLARQQGSLAFLWAARSNAGVAYRALNQLPQARQALEEAITLTETMRAQVAGGEQAQQRFFEDKLPPYYAMVDLLVAQKQPLDALTFAERARSRALLDVLQTGRVNITKTLTSQEQATERNLRGELSALNLQVARLSRKEKPAQDKLRELEAQRDKARLAYESFQTKLYAAHPKLRSQRGEAPVINFAELAALLPDADSALLEYVVLEEVTYLFIVTKAASPAGASLQVYTLPLKQAELAEKTESLRQQLAGRDLGFRAASRQLYQLLLKPAQAQLQGKTRLVIVPDNKLWELPFQALLAENDQYLIEQSAISYAPSLTVLREMQTQRDKSSVDSPRSTLLALGNPALGNPTLARTTLALRNGKLDPLPEAEQEVKALGQLYGAAHSKVYVGAEAREERAKTEAAQARILHFATHGVINDAAPLYSHLVLSQSEPNEAKSHTAQPRAVRETQPREAHEAQPRETHEDGLLEAWELMRLDLKADLAVLSACETARGRYGAGEGVIGLTWALFVAGVPATVVSQWKVESASTRELMLHFHRALQTPASTGKARPTKAEALRQADLKLLKNPETSHPFYWAGFVLVGDGR